jgi:hypothetical protein
MAIQSMELTLGMGQGHKNVTVYVKFVDGRSATAVDGYPHMYSIRGSDRDPGAFFSIEEGNVGVNFVGRVFSKKPLPLGDTGMRVIRDWWMTGDSDEPIPPKQAAEPIAEFVCPHCHKSMGHVYIHSKCVQTATLSGKKLADYDAPDVGVTEEIQCPHCAGSLLGFVEE